MNIQTKVSGVLGLIIIFAFGISTWVNTGQTVSVINRTADEALRVLEKAEHDRVVSVFSSLETGAKGSLERGEMEIFDSLITDLGQIPGVGEIGITDAGGQIVFSSSKKGLSQSLDKSIFSGSIKAAGKVMETEGDSAIVLARTHYLSESCMDCHTEAKVGDIAGVFFVRYRKADILRAEGSMNAAMAMARQKSILTGLAAGAGGLLVSLLGVYFLLGGLVRRPLQKLRELMREMGQGNLTRRLQLTQVDEIGETGRAMDEMAEKLSALVHKISRSSGEMARMSENISNAASQVDESARMQAQGVNDTSEAVMKISMFVGEVGEGVNNLNNTGTECTSSALELAASVEEVAQNAENLFQAVDEVSSSITEMAASIKQVADGTKTLKDSSDTTASSVAQMDVSITQVEQNAKETASITEAVRRDAEAGKYSVDATISGISDIRHASKSTAMAIQALSEKAKNIGTILSVIDEVTDQTNLLALNAAIIAAQAGEHGKAFAVVADEIRELADRTSSSTREIGSIIQGVQVESEMAVKSISKSEQSIVEGVRLSQQSGEALTKIVSGIESVAERMEHIARASVEQTTGSRMIREAIEKVSEMADQSARATEEQSLGTEMIMRATERMKDLTNQVKNSTREQSSTSNLIARSMESINEMIQQIKYACDEQKRESDQIVRSVDSIRNSTEINLEATEVMSGAVSTQAQQIDVLQEEMKSFKVDGQK